MTALTAYGDGVMFLAPFSGGRFKAPWQPFHGILPAIFAIWFPALGIISYCRSRSSDSLSPAP